MQRGEVWWAELPPPIGRRPVVLLSRNRAYRVRTNVTFALITRTVRGLPTEVPLGPDDGMPQPCVINADDILTAPKTALTERITSLGPDKLQQIAFAVRFALDIS